MTRPTTNERIRTMPALASRPVHVSRVGELLARVGHAVTELLEPVRRAPGTYVLRCGDCPAERQSLVWFDREGAVVADVRRCSRCGSHHFRLAVPVDPALKYIVRPTN